jgi:hypothetical protein
MQPLFLKAAVHIAAVRDDLVCLDADAGDYACLPGLGRAVSAPGPDGHLDVANPQVADLLLEAGLATHEPGLQARTGLPPSAITSCWRRERVEVTSRDMRRCVHAYLTAAPRFWRAPFRGLVKAGPGHCGGCDSAAPALWRDAQVFDQLAPFAPFQGECLFRAFVLRAYLRLDGLDATWVFGVRTYPFQAHCWLQAGDVLLNDALERICAFTPIFAV